MAHEPYNDIGFCISLFAVGQVETGVCRYIGLHNQYIGTGFGDDPGGNVFGRRFAKVVDVRFECKTHAGNNRFASVLFYEITARFQYFIGAPVGFIIIGFTGTFDELRLFWIVRYDKPRVYGDAMTAYTAARLQYVDSRVLVGKFYQFPHVDFCFIADHR